MTERPIPARSSSYESAATEAAPVAEPADAKAELIASRERLRGALIAIAHPPPRRSILANGPGGMTDELVARARALPLAAALFEGTKAWWQKHPVRRGAEFVGAASSSVVEPVAREHPQSVVLFSAIAGALLSLVPVRMIVFRLLRPALFVGLIVETVKAGLRQARTPPER